MIDAITIFFATKIHIGIVLVAISFLLLLPIQKRITLTAKALIALPVAFLSGRLVTLFISSPRPFVVENIQPLIAHIPDNGFPSEHTLLVATISAIVFTENKTLGAILGVFAISVGVARVLADVHHGVDIVGSIIIGIASVSTAHFVVLQYRKRQASTPFLPTHNI